MAILRLVDTIHLLLSKNITSIISYSLATVQFSHPYVNILTCKCAHNTFILPDLCLVILIIPPQQLTQKDDILKVAIVTLPQNLCSQNKANSVSKNAFTRVMSYRTVRKKKKAALTFLTAIKGRYGEANCFKRWVALLLFTYLPWKKTSSCSPPKSDQSTYTEGHPQNRSNQRAPAL